MGCSSCRTQSNPASFEVSCGRRCGDFGAARFDEGLQDTTASLHRSEAQRQRSSADRCRESTLNEGARSTSFARHTPHLVAEHQDAEDQPTGGEVAKGVQLLAGCARIDQLGWRRLPEYGAPVRRPRDDEDGAEQREDDQAGEAHQRPPRDRLVAAVDEAHCCQRRDVEGDERAATCNGTSEFHSKSGVGVVRHVCGALLLWIWPADDVAVHPVIPC